MNLITFNEHFATVASREGKERYEKACVAPLFDYSIVRDNVVAALNRQIKEHSVDDGEGGKSLPITLPFPIFRAEFKVLNREGEAPVTRYDAFIFSGEARVYYRLVGDRKLRNHLFCLDLNADRTASVLGWVDKKKQWVELMRNEVGAIDKANREGAQEVYAQLIGGLVAFSDDAMSPNVHLATVEPATNGEPRSVQWVKARTHYTFISHGHPANKKGVGVGSRVPSDPTKELTRMAHNRRAHYKHLQHPRYRFARGRRIFVRATWVGPKEWRDEGGKQIYRILEPTDWQPGEGVRP
jgi:hypothetical protein